MCAVQRLSDSQIVYLAEQAWLSSGVTRTPPIVLKQSDDGTAASSDPTSLEAGESITRLLKYLYSDQPYSDSRKSWSRYCS
ncbi:hypothetical protein DVH24_013676 [Malus domestica]|uniref:Uncharacterized protein n=1 Tax=Malus domestica TaxID=3750 RepID=A0A498JC78_MALDO|nr:hypothetical protein DVH24_013676 [Malus domestica]